MQATRRSAGPDGKGVMDPLTSPPRGLGEGARLEAVAQRAELGRLGHRASFRRGEADGRQVCAERSSPRQQRPPSAGRPARGPARGWLEPKGAQNRRPQHPPGRADSLSDGRPPPGRAPTLGPRGCALTLARGPQAGSAARARPPPWGRQGGGSGRTSCPRVPSSWGSARPAAGGSRARAGRARAGPQPPRLGEDSRPGQPRAERRGTRAAAALGGPSRGEGAGPRGRARRPLHSPE